MALETITLDDALRLLSLPRTLGEGSDGVEIVAQNGRYGPFVKMGTETRSLEGEEQLFTLTLEQAQELLAQPKVRRGRGQGASQPPLRELGADPTSGKPTRGEGRQVRALRDRRRDERELAPRRRGRVADDRAGTGTARCQARSGSVEATQARISK